MGVPKVHWWWSIQICQFCLSFYPRPNISDLSIYRYPSHFIFVGDKKDTSQSTQKGKGDELNSIKYFTQVTGAQIFAKHNFQPSNLNLTMKSGSVSNAILSFFSQHGLYFYPTKDRCLLRLTSTLLYICCNFGQIFWTSNVIQFFSVQNMSHD